MAGRITKSQGTSARLRPIDSHWPCCSESMLASKAEFERLTVTPKQAARLAGVDVSFVYAWVHSGELPHFCAGRSIKIPVEGLHEFIRRKSGIGAEPGVPLSKGE